MKKYSCVLWIPLLFQLLSSCYEDKGNYDYQWVSELSITGLRDTAVNRGDILKIEPELKQILGDSSVNPNIDLDDYTFRWYSQVLQSGEPVILSIEQCLNDTIWLPVAKGYMVTYEVVEKATGLSWRKRFNLNVEGRYAGAFFYLTEDENKQVELDIFGRDAKKEWSLEKGVLARSGFPYRGGGANCVCYQGVANDKRLWVATGEATGFLDMLNFAWEERNLARSIMAIPQPVSYTFEKIMIIGGKVVFLNPEGGAHLINNYKMIFPDFAVTGGRKTELASYAGGTSKSTLLYDRQNKRLVSHCSDIMNSDAEVTLLSTKDAAEGMELIHLQDISDSKVLVIMNDPTTGKYWKYTYSFSRNANNKIVGIRNENETEELKNAELLGQAEYIACERSRGYVYFSVGNKLYTYRSGGGLDKPVECEGVTFEHPITMLYVFNSGSQANGIFAAMYDRTKGNSGGTVYKLLPNLENCQQIALEGEPVNGLGQVKSMTSW